MIEIGDSVDIHFHGSRSIFGGEVLYKPCDTGDSWHIREENGMEVYVMFFERMDKLKAEAVKE